jgi:hypothetical protein
MKWEAALLNNWSPEFAWWLAVLYGDGNVYRQENNGDYRITVVGSWSTTTRWLRLISSEPREPKTVKHSPGTFQAYVNSKTLVEWFEKERGICGPKSSSLVWPEDLPLELRVHFLRGLWDTDGSLSIWDARAHRIKSNPQFKTRYGSNTKSFVYRVRSELESLVSVPRVVVENDRGQYRVNYSGSSGFLVADLLYRDAPEHLRNEDRMQVYLEADKIRDIVDDSNCPCGRTATHEGMCQRCWWENHGRTTGPGTTCKNGCGKPVKAHGLCVACYTKTVRSLDGWTRKSTGTCSCGRPAYRKGMCDACYSRERRARKVA